MAGTSHCTVRTITTAGGFAFFLILHQAHNYQGDDKRKHKAYNNGCKVL